MTRAVWDERAGSVLAGLFSGEEDRLARMSGEVGGIYFDVSKSLISAAQLSELFQSVESAGFKSKRTQLFSGGIANASENRAATHVAERGSGSGPAIAAAENSHVKARALANRIRAGEFGAVSHVLHLGIGGSALGPALLIDAIGRTSAIEVAVISNIDGASLEPVLQRFDPTQTIVLIASKTFTTAETMTNAASAINWMRAGGVQDPLARCVGLTAAPKRALAFGISEAMILDFAETVGGRYSIWSSIGLPVAIALGNDELDAFREGAATMDRHFLETPVDRNWPLIAAMIDAHYTTVLSLEARAVFAYDDRLKLLPPYLQQLEMESNGKGVTAEGITLAGPSGAVTWGGAGTDAQHAVFQLLHQGTHVVPVEFVAVLEPGHSLDKAHHRQLLGNCFAQGAALMRGRSYLDALGKSSGNPALARAKTFPGDRPSSTILLERLDARTLGALIAFYEHRTFSAAVLLGINPFDQWGVELGKEIATAIASGEIGDFDPSTRALLARAAL